MSQIPSTNERSLCKPRDHAANVAVATPLRAGTCCVVLVFSGRVYPFQMEDDGNEEIGDRSVPRRRSSSPRLRSAQGARNNPLPKCAHKKKTLKCALISPSSARSFKDKFLGLPKKNRRAFILMFRTSGPVKRRTGPDTTSHHGLSATYKVRLDDKKVVTVCRDMFCAVLGVSHSTVTRLLKHEHDMGEIKLENRGGDHKVKRYGAKLAAVVGFMKRLCARESHFTVGRRQRSFTCHRS